VYGVVACGGCGGCPVAVASRHGRSGPVGTAAACQLVGVRQRAGAGGRWLGYGPACFYAGGQRPAAGQVRLGVWAGVAAHLAVGGAAGVPRGRAGPHRGQRLAGAALSCRRSSWARPSWWRSIRWPLRQPVALSGRRGGRRPPRGPVLCTVWVAFWPVGGPSCAAGEVQHGEGWPWRQPVAGDPGARTAWRSAC
jgi:hypothetical protein